MLKFYPINFNFPEKILMDKFVELKLLGQRIRELRIEKKLSQAKLGLRIYKDQQSIHKIESGKFNPSYIYLLEICEGLEITIEELLSKKPKL